MVPRMRAFGNRMVLAAAGMPVVLGMQHWSNLSEERRSLLAAQELLRQQGYACGTVDCLRLRNVVGNL